MPSAAGDDSSPVVTLYGRSNCGLCEEAERMLRAINRDVAFTLRSVNIEADPVLLDRYVFAIPVIIVGEVEIARAPLRRASLEDALRAALLPARK